jgi:hypothetical protein
MPATGNTSTRSVTITNGTSLSAEVDLEGMRLVAILMPAAWTAANLTFQGADVTGGAYADAYDDAGAEVSVTAAASRFISLDTRAVKIAGRFIKVRSGTTGVPVNQAADRTLVLILRGL